MSRLSSLDAIIERVEDASHESNDAQKLIILNQKDGHAVKRKPAFQSVQFVLVKNSNDSLNVAEFDLPVLPVQNFATDARIGLCIACQVRCTPGNEPRAAEALGMSNPPLVVFEKRIFSWALAFLRGREADLVSNLADVKTELSNVLKSRARDELGLDIEIRLALENADRIDTHKIRGWAVDARPSDWDTDVDLQFDLDLGVRPGGEQLAVLHFTKLASIQDRIAPLIRNYFAMRVTLQEFYVGFETSDHKRGLIEAIDQGLLREGRFVDALKIARDQGRYAAPPFVERTIEISSELQEYPKPVPLTNRVQMTLKNIADYERGGRPDLDKWLKNQLNQIIHKELFNARYKDILLNFDDYQARMKTQMADAAAAIGYTLDQLIALPDLEPLRWKDSLEVTINEESYATNSPAVDARLQVVIRGRIPDLSKIENMINNHQDVPQLIREAANSAIADYLHHIDPERFYMRFGYSPKENEKSVHDELKARIRDVLTKTFHTDDPSIAIKMLDTEPTIRLKKLEESAHDFALHVHPLTGNEVIEYNGQYRVEAVDSKGWHRFLSRKFSPQDIAAVIEKSLQAKLKTMTPEQLKFLQPKHHESMQAFVKNFILDTVVEQFGLVVSLVFFDRNQTDSEIEVAEIMALKDRTKLKQIDSNIRKVGYQIDKSRNVAQKKQADDVATFDQLKGLLMSARAEGASEEEIEDLNRQLESMGLDEEDTTIESQEAQLERLQNDRLAAAKAVDFDAAFGLAAPTNSERVELSGQDGDGPDDDFDDDSNVIDINQDQP